MPFALITGCSGFIASHLVEELLKKNWTVIGIDNFHPYYSRKLKEQNLNHFINHENFTFLEGSILSKQVLSKIPDNVDYVFHFAAIAGVRNSIENPKEYFEINVKGTLNLLEKFSSVKNFVFASSSSVYGNLQSTELPVKEDHSLNPISPYGESKKQAEQLCLDLATNYDTNVTILRFYTVYGPRQRPDEAITKFIRLAQQKKPIPIYGDGTKERDFTYVSDIVHGSILAALYGKGIYNLGTGNPISVNQMVEIIEKAMGVKIEKKFLPNPQGDVEKTHADISKAKNEIHFIPKMSFDNGISECVQWCEDTKCVE